MGYYGFEMCDDYKSDVPGYEVVAEFGEWDYEWSTMRVYKRDGRLFIITDGGCSCDDWHSTPKTEAMMVELPSLNSARDAVKNFLSYDFEREQDAYLNAVEKFRELGLR